MTIRVRPGDRFVSYFKDGYSLGTVLRQRDPHPRFDMGLQFIVSYDILETDPGTQYVIGAEYRGEVELDPFGREPMIVKGSGHGAFKVTGTYVYVMGGS